MMRWIRVKREASCDAARITLASLYLEGWNERSNQCIGDSESKSLEVGDGDLHRLAYPWVIRNGIRAELDLNPLEKNCCCTEFGRFSAAGHCQWI
jgi:hypothetical protein